MSIHLYLLAPPSFVFFHFVPSCFTVVYDINIYLNTNHDEPTPANVYISMVYILLASFSLFTVRLIRCGGRM